MNKKLVKQDFFLDHTSVVAQKLLGCFLIREYKGRIIKAKITETEAYRGVHDLACHASKGITERTKTMFGPPGRLYIYMVYGMHYMLNIVTEKEGYPAAVLIRGMHLLKPNNISENLDGPGKITKRIHLNKNQNGLRLDHDSKIWVEAVKRENRSGIIKGPRIGVDYAGHCKNWKWNFKLVD